MSCRIIRYCHAINESPIGLKKPPPPTHGVDGHFISMAYLNGFCNNHKLLLDDFQDAYGMHNNNTLSFRSDITLSKNCKMVKEIFDFYKFILVSAAALHEYDKTMQ